MNYTKPRVTQQKLIGLLTKISFCRLNPNDERCIE